MTAVKWTKCLVEIYSEYVNAYTPIEISKRLPKMSTISLHGLHINSNKNYAHDVSIYVCLGSRHWFNQISYFPLQMSIGLIYFCCQVWVFNSTFVLTVFMWIEISQPPIKHHRKARWTRETLRFRSVERLCEWVSECMCVCVCVTIHAVYMSHCRMKRRILSV